MNRCTTPTSRVPRVHPHTPVSRRPTPRACRPGPRAFVAAVALACLLLPTLPAQAQEIRNFPPAALRGRLLVTAPPQVELDGKPDLLAPGARIRNQQNMLVVSGAVVGQALRVNYTREASTGMLQEVWVLTEAEAALRRPGDRPWYRSLFGLD